MAQPLRLMFGRALSHLRRVVTVGLIATVLGLFGSHAVLAQDSLFVEEYPIGPPERGPIILWSHGSTSYFSVCPAGDSVSAGIPWKVHLTVVYYNALREPMVGVPPSAIYITYTTDGTLKVNDQPSPIYANDSTNADGKAFIDVPSLSGSGHLIVTLHVDGSAPGTPTSLEVRSTDTDALPDNIVEVADTTSAWDLNRNSVADDGPIVAAHIGHWHRHVLFGTPVRRTSLGLSTMSYGSGGLAWQPGGDTLALDIHTGTDETDPCAIFREASDPINGNTITKFSFPPGGGIDDYDPAWSPLGNVIAYDRGDSKIYFKGIPGAVADTSEQLITESGDGGVGDILPTFSADGSQIAFCRFDSLGVPHIWQLDLVTGSATQLTTGTGADFWPRWSTDGAYIVFRRTVSGLNRLYKVPAGGGSATEVFAPSGQDAEAGVYSPDAKVIAASVTTGGDTQELQVINPAVSSPPGHANFQPMVSAEGMRMEFSPDGTRMAIVALPPGGSEDEAWATRRNMSLPPVISAVGGHAILPRTPVRDTTIEVGQSLAQAVTVSDPESDSLSYNIIGKKLGMTGTSVLSWTPDTSGIGHNSVKFIVTTRSGGTSYAISRIAVLPVKVANLDGDARRYTAVLTWTEPGQGHPDADAYDIRYKTTGPVTESNFASDTSVTLSLSGALPSPGPGGTEHCLELSLTGCSPYYFGMKTRKADQWSKLSDTSSVHTYCSGSASIFCDEGDMFAGGGGGGEESAMSPGLRSEHASLGVQSGESDVASGENSLLWGGLGAAAKDIHKLSGYGAPDSVYHVQLREIGGRAAVLDQVALGAVDHDAGVDAIAGVDSVYLGTLSDISSATSGASEVGSTVNGDGYLGAAGELVTVNLGDNSGNAALVVGSNGSAMRASPDSVGILVQKPGPDSTWITIATIHPRRNADLVAVPTRGSDTVRLALLRSYEVTALRKMSISNVTVPQQLQMLAAAHSRLGSVMEAVDASGGDSTRLVPGDTLNLSFAATQTAGSVRDVFLTASGSYGSGAAGTSEHLEGNSASALVVSPTWQFALGAAHPNPSLGNVSIEYTLAQETPVSIRVYNVAGRLVKTLVSGTGTPGLHDITWNAADDHGRKVGAGVYFYRMEAGSWRSQRKVVFLEH